MSGNKSQPTPECCICGDCGLSSELFRCRVCLFRFQHRYCSNLYPREESYQLCNWCLIHDDTKVKSQSGWNSSSSNKTCSENGSKNVKIINLQGGLKSQRSALSLQMNGPIKKPKSPERPPSTRRRLITEGKLEEKHKRSRSERMSKTNIGIIKQVYRNKVRRYKLLDEVST